jgi:hypothetical protein
MLAICSLVVVLSLCPLPCNPHLDGLAFRTYSILLSILGLFLVVVGMVYVP